MTTLLKDGYLVLSSNQPLEDTVLSLLPPGYRFLTYKYTILGPALLTYHRDVTSSQSSFHTEYPTYTVIQYDYDGDFLSVSPGSHRLWQFRPPVTLKGKKGTAVLFNCDLVHGGIDAPPTVERKAIQYKVAHEDDLPLLEELQGVDIVQEGKPLGYLTKVFLRLGSYLCIVPIERFFRPLLQRRISTGFSSFIQRLFPLPYFNTPSKEE